MYTTTGFLSGLLSKRLLDVYGHFLKHSNGNNNVCNVLALTDLNLYTPNGKLVKPNKLKSKGILLQLKRTSNIHLKT